MNVRMMMKINCEDSDENPPYNLPKRLAKENPMIPKKESINFNPEKIPHNGQRTKVPTSHQLETRVNSKTKSTGTFPPPLPRPY